MYDPVFRLLAFGNVLGGSRHSHGLAVVTQDAAELPLRRVYVTVNGERSR